ncbi:LacI family DNA-binding transcriptional regulator [Nocardioides fonticola]|uniref:LacI family DNA-binding transcriptional regulator n=1 Tax=Nocardioides fonticola TaxID=450363 RepID=A0ABP7XI43_9ACTN
MVTLADVAARAGVSISAVSKVLSGDPSLRVTEPTRERIKAAARELNYRPNFAGRALKSARTQVLGIVVPDLTNALFTDLMDGVEDAAREAGYVVLLGRSDDPRPDAEVYQRLLGEGRVDGLIVQVVDGVAPDGLGALLENNPPVVLINSVAPGQVGSVLLDDVAGARVATEHLLDLGHRRLALVNGLPTSLTAERRRQGFREALADAGVPRRGLLETRLGYRPENGRAALEEILAAPRRPTGVVVANVNAAIGLLAAAREHGVRVPEDLSVVTVHDSWTAENTWPPLTAVSMRFYAMGRAAVDTLVARLDSGTVRDVVITDPPPQLTVRESTAPPSA